MAAPVAARRYPNLMTCELVHKYAAPVPRYTSYPTAPNFTAEVTRDDYARWLSQLPDNAPLSLYAHIPFCDTLCWYCGCNTKQVRRYSPVAAYLPALLKEICNVAALVPGRAKVAHVHWGGGSPNILAGDDILKLADAMRGNFAFADDMEFAVEIDPRRLEADRVSAFARAGLTRVSLGVQDFAQKVQDAINRQQPFEVTKRAVERFRAAGVGSVNLDLVYGLPHQTERSVLETIDLALQLKPDRIALFGYAHLPSKLPHQRMIADSSLPGPLQRFAQANQVAARLLQNGYVRVGLDHFALPHDSLASGNVQRNFQGYTTDKAETLIGFGASAIGHLPQGYVQNAVPSADYARRVESHGLATARGVELSCEDRLRASLIERLMCDLTFDPGELAERFGDVMVAPVLQEAAELVAADSDGLIEAADDGFTITEKGRPFVRTICAHFDAYLGTSPAKHAMGV